MYGDPSWNEYLSTGIDPTGGDLGPDFDPETGEYLDEVCEEEVAVREYIPSFMEIAWSDYALSADNNFEDRERGNLNSPQYLFFDTETTGLPYDDSISAEVDHRNWPRLIQLSWIMTDGKGVTTKEMNKIVYPEGFSIPSDATEIHGITTDFACYWGERLERVLHVFNKSLRKADYIICHNAWFDINVVYGEMIRKNIKTPLLDKKSYCTMQSGTDLCAIGWRIFGYKWPTLQELHTHLFKRGFTGAHDAMTDVRALVRCFWEMRKNGKI